jgi:protein-serine/threonine kinase
MDPNRLHLNFPRGQGNSNLDTDRSYQTSNQQVYPTTPSTFPQPVFGGGQGQFANQQMPGNAGGNYGDGSYFNNNAQYQQQYNQQAQYGGQQYPTGNQAYSSRFAANDPNAGLARQFSNQNLGTSSQRQQSPFGRQQAPPGPPRPRTGGSGAQQQPGSLLNPAGITSDPSKPAEDETPPEQDYDKYSSNVSKRVVGLHVGVETFFKDNITRAKDRNQR